MSPYESSGSFTTESREVAISETWDSWANPQASSNVVVVDGSLQLAEAPDIPNDEVDHRWIMGEGSGTSLADSVGSVPATFNGTWVSGSQYAGGAATEYNGSSEYGSTDSPVDVNGAEFTVMLWTDTLTNNDTLPRLIATAPNDSSRVDNGWEVVLNNGETDALRLDYREGGSTNTLFGAEGTGIPDLNSGQHFVAVLGNGDSGRLLVYDTSQQQTDASGSAGRGTTASETMVWMAGDDRYVGGILDDVMTRASELSVSTVEEIWQNTGPNA